MRKQKEKTIKLPDDVKKSGGISHIIDAENQPLGRLASRVAVLLRGKNNADFMKNKDSKVFVFIKNINKIKLSGKKLEQKKYYKHSGYLGGLKETPLKKVFEKNPKESLKRAVFGMLPKNKLRALQIKRLKILPGSMPEEK